MSRWISLFTGIAISAVTMSSLESGIVVGIETVEILVGLVDHLRVDGPEGSIRAGVAEIKSELPGLDLDRHGVGRRWSEIYVSPSLDSEDSQGHTSAPTRTKAAITKPLAPPGKFLILRPGLGLENCQMKMARMNWAARNEIPASAMVSDICSSIRCAMRRDVLGRHPGVAEDGNRGRDCDYDDGDRKEFRHDASPPAGFSADCCEAPLARRSGLDAFYFALNVKSAVAGLPAATVTFCV